MLCDNCTLRCTCLGCTLFDRTGTLFFGRWAVKLTDISVLALGTCTPFHSTGTLFFGRWTIKVTGSSDLALRTLAWYWYINQGKISSVQFSKSVDFLDASQVTLMELLSKQIR